MFDSLFGGGSDPAEEFAKSMAGYEEMLLGYYQPFMDQTFSQLGNLEQQYSMLLSNPGALYDMMAMGFSASPGYQYQVDQSMNAANSAAAAGGMAGTNAHQTTAMTQANNLANQDFNNYMSQMTNLYSKGLSGTENLHQMNYKTGYSASTDMARYIAELMQAEAGIAAQQAQAESDFWGQLTGMGLGYAIGGPIGMGIGGSLF